MGKLSCLLLLVLVILIVSVVAAKRRGVFTGVWYFIVVSLFSYILVITIGNTYGNSAQAFLSAFISPIVGIIVSFSTPTSKRLAELHGESDEYKRCPYCAEAIKREAVKCKHCGSYIPCGDNTNAASDKKKKPYGLDE
ncbi:zinc ribbon domain-containing protein [Edwardsiella tarda]|uniref:zinc ribbon domain-containing protein n=1 Tax=Edwardsiella tarda TaxID=636 RepID=UPI001A9C83D2|nr:hypothetical protein [Edwardsiella tarda]UCQ52889.1 zinc ribbon domain-containing protein [Edwardsiella tarda]